MEGVADAGGTAAGGSAATGRADCSSRGRDRAFKALDGLWAPSQRLCWTDRAKALIPPIQNISTLLRHEMAAIGLMDDTRQTERFTSERSFSTEPPPRACRLRRDTLTARSSIACLKIFIRASLLAAQLSRECFGANGRGTAAIQDAV